MAFSHVTTDAGHRMPVREISRVARAQGALTFVDMAHSAGLYPMSLPEMGCDFAGILSYKWMYAPYAAGALYVRRERLNDLHVTYAVGRAEAWLNFKTDQFALKDDAERFQYGPWSWPLVHTWIYSLNYLSRIGLAEIWKRTVALTTRLKTGLRQIPGVRLMTPESPDLSAALVTFQVEGWDGFALQDAMRRRWNIVIKGFDNVYQGVRTSVPFFLLEEEIDLLLDAVRTLALEGPRR